MLWHVADCFQNGIIKQSSSKVLIAFLVGSTADEVMELHESHRLVHMICASKCLQEDGMTNVKQFVQHYYQHQDGDPPLEDKEWDQSLLRRLKEALQLEKEVRIACAQRGLD